MEEKKYLKWYNKVGYGSGDIAGNVVYAFFDIVCHDLSDRDGWACVRNGWNFDRIFEVAGWIYRYFLWFTD